MADDIVQRLRDKELLSVEEDGHTHFLPKNPDGDDGAAEIERLRAENEKLRAALKPFAVKYKINDDSLPNTHNALTLINVGDLRAAAAALKESGE